MKKGIIVTGLAAVLSVSILSGCESHNQIGDETYEGSKMIIIEKRGRSIYLVRDQETGCVYMKRRGTADTAAYYGEDGKVVGCGDKTRSKDGLKYE